MLTHELATLMVFPLSWPSKTPRTRLLRERGTRAAWSTTERRTRG